MALGALIARIVGIYLAVHGLTGLAQWLPFFFQGFSRSSIGPLIGPLALGAVLITAGLVFLAKADAIGAKLLPAELPGANLDMNQVQVIAFRVIGVWLLFQAVGHLVSGAASAIIVEMVRRPSESSEGFNSAYFRTQNLVRGVLSGLLAIIQGVAGFWLLLRPERLIVRIDLWRAKRHLDPVDEQDLTA